MNICTMGMGGTNVCVGGMNDNTGIIPTRTDTSGSGGGGIQPWPPKYPVKVVPRCKPGYSDKLKKAIDTTLKVRKAVRVAKTAATIVSAVARKKRML